MHSLQGSCKNLAKNAFLGRSFKEIFSLQDLARKLFLERSCKEMFPLQDLATKLFPWKNVKLYKECNGRAFSESKRSLSSIHRSEAVLRKHLQRKLRTSEENQISNIIQRTKGKRILLKFHQFYSAKNTRRDTHKSRKPFFPNWKQQKIHHSQRKTFQKTENWVIFFEFVLMFSGKSHSAENLD